VNAIGFAIAALILVHEVLILVSECLILVGEGLILVGEGLILVNEALILVEENAMPKAVLYENPYGERYATIAICQKALLPT
jgi:hypothetical protein